MRVKFGDRIYSCTVATHTKNSNLMLLTTSNGVYTVDVETAVTANILHDRLLVDGYCDFSKYEYSN